MNTGSELLENRKWCYLSFLRHDDDSKRNNLELQYFLCLLIVSLIKINP